MSNKATSGRPQAWVKNSIWPFMSLVMTARWWMPDGAVMRGPPLLKGATTTITNLMVEHPVMADDAVLSAPMVNGVPSSRELWLRAGQTLLRRGGSSAVKLQALTDELGLTTGSFYH